MEVNLISQGRQNTNTVNIETLSENLLDNMQSVEGVSRNNSEISANEKDFTVKDLEKSVDKLNKLFEGKETYVEYEVYGKFKDITIKIVNEKTKKVIKEIPPKKIIDMVEKLCELAGMFIDQKA